MGFKIKAAARLGGDFLDLKALVKESGAPVLVLFRIQDFKAVESATGFEGWNFPVFADALICSGPRKGEIRKGERFIGAITSVLRGVKNARKDKGEKPQEPVNDVGDLILARIELLNEGRNNEAAVGNVPSDADVSAIEGWYEDSVWDQESDSAPAVKETASAGAGKSTRPW